MSKSGQKSCNRRPFLSGDGCDRGSVDINQFDDFPYCDKIDPTMPAIPPEIVDTPLQIPVPPSCACVNIKYALNFKYSKDRKFGANADFAARGDCCEGNYISNFNLQIPCPILGGGSKKIKMKIGYGNGKSYVDASYIKANSDSCTVEAKDVDINLNIPCPVNDAKGKRIKIGISYGEGKREVSASFLRTDTDKCEVEALAPTFNLNLPCPVIGRNGTPKIRASIKYGNGDSKTSASYIKADPKECTIEPLSPNINLNIPCPIKGTSGGTNGKKIKIGISYGNGKKEVSASFLRTNTENCELEALSPRFYLNLHCPLADSSSSSSSSGVAGKIKIGISYGDGDQEASSSFIKFDIEKCRLRPMAPNIKLHLPCPVIGRNKKPPKIKAKIGWGENGQSASASFLTADSKSCQIKGMDAFLNLNLPCPLADSSSSSSNSSSGVAGKIKIGISYGDGDQEASSSFIKFDIEKCRLRPMAPNIKLHLPCPVIGRNKKPPKIKAKIGWGENGQSASASFLTADSKSCQIKGVDAFLNLNLPCPKVKIVPGKIETGPTGTITIESSTVDEKCDTVFKINVKFPEGGTSIDKEVVTDMKYEGHTLKIELTRFKNGKHVSRWKNVFTAVSHKSDHVCCNDA